MADGRDVGKKLLQNLIFGRRYFRRLCRPQTLGHQRSYENILFFSGLAHEFHGTNICCLPLNSLENSGESRYFSHGKQPVFIQILSRIQKRKDD